jgi:hypothetical protein
MERFVKVKSRDKLGIVLIESKNYHEAVFDPRTNSSYIYKTLNEVLLEDGTTMMVQDDDMEEVDAGTTKDNKQD